jgi:peptidyl-prolyl cis-trans isomerase C
MTKAA